MGDKYIIELEEKPFHDDNGDFLYRVKGFNSLVFDMTGVGKMTPYTEPDMEKVRADAYNDGYKAGLDAGYKYGKYEAWEAARKIWQSDIYLRIFKVPMRMDCFTKYSASEAIEKIRQYEQGKKEELDGLRQNIQTIVDKCGYTLDEIAEVLREMRGE